MDVSRTVVLTIGGTDSHRLTMRCRRSPATIGTTITRIPPVWPTSASRANSNPWGYLYYNVGAGGKGGARNDHALNPPQHGLRPLSIGADCKTKPQITQKDSLDNVIRASNGAFVGLAATF